MKKIAVAFSGGRDSAAAAVLLKNQGYQITGFFLRLWPETNLAGGRQALAQAEKTAKFLELKLEILDLRRLFKKLVVDDFLEAEQFGETPNPCVHCNKLIKFGRLAEIAQDRFQADYLATGHYARLDHRLNSAGKKVVGIRRARDRTKDQSYFLYRLIQKNLSRLIFPLGDRQKSEIIKLTDSWGLPTARESRGACFLGEKEYCDFLKQKLNFSDGEIINPQGKILGRHQGLPCYTLGQRTGLDLAGGPWYVSGFDFQNNRLIVVKNQRNSDIYQKIIFCREVSWPSGRPKLPIFAQVQLRYQARPVSCRITAADQGVKLEFSRRQRAPAPGQSAVFYDRQRLLGGGIIDKSILAESIF